MVATHGPAAENVMHRTHVCCAGKRRVVRGLWWVPCHPPDTGSGTHVSLRRAGGHENGGVVRFMAGCHVRHRACSDPLNSAALRRRSRWKAPFRWQESPGRVARGRGSGVVVEQHTLHGGPWLVLGYKVLNTHRKHCDAPCRTGKSGDTIPIGGENPKSGGGRYV